MQINNYDNSYEKGVAERAAWRQKRRNRRLTLACLVGITLLLAVITACVIRLMPLYAEYSYETKINTLNLPKLSGPSEVSLVIYYQHEMPTDIQIRNTTNNIQYEYTADDSVPGQISLICDLQDTSLAYQLTLIPQDNYALDYKVDVQPSRNDIPCTIRTSVNSRNQMLVTINADYIYNQDDIKCYIDAQGDRFSKTSETYVLERNKDFTVNLSDIYGDNVANIQKVTVFVYQMGIDPETGIESTIRSKKQIFQRWDR